MIDTKFSIILLLFLLSYSFNIAQNKKVEEIGIKCIIDAYEKVGVDIIKETLFYEKTLLEDGIIKDNTWNSYKELHEKTIKLDSVPVSLPDHIYDNISKVKSGFFLTNECYNEMTLAKNYSESFYFRMNKKMKERIPDDPKITRSYGIKIFLSTIQKEDFDISFNKTTTLIALILANKEGNFKSILE